MKIACIVKRFFFKIQSELLLKVAWLSWSYSQVCMCFNTFFLQNVTADGTFGIQDNSNIFIVRLLQFYLFQKLAVDELKELKEDGVEVEMAGDGKYDSPGDGSYMIIYHLTIYFQAGQQSIAPTQFSPCSQRRQLGCGLPRNQW